MIFAGIDEAGLGPVLGPLVVTAAAFEADLPADTDLWNALRIAVVRKKPRKQGSAIAIGDSKKLFNRKKDDGLIPLEQGVLAMLMQLANFEGKLPENFAQLLNKISPAAVSECTDYPWYAPAEVSLPLQADAMSVRLSANAVKSAMKQAGVYFVGMHCEPMFAGQFNKYIDATDNKSVTTFDCTCRGLMWLWQSFVGRDMTVIVDRQGGRVHYRQPLQRVFPGCSLKVIEETDKLSRYQLRDETRTVDVSFAVGGEDVSLATALASMTSKYVRELFMEQFNAYWLQKIDGLEPTAGYYVDGNRFFDTIEPHIENLKIDRNLIYRNR